MAVPADSASQYPCGWSGTQSWKGGETLTLLTAKRSASTKASTAALRPFSQRLLLLQPCVSPHPASGQKCQEGNRGDSQKAAQNDAQFPAPRSSEGRQEAFRDGSSIASVTRVPLDKVRISPIDRQALEHRQRVAAIAWPPDTLAWGGGLGSFSRPPRRVRWPFRVAGHGR
jgi:hypothetical protein